MVDININTNKIKAKYKTNKLGKFAGKELHRLLMPFTPQREKNLVRTANYNKPWILEYIEPYAKPIYDGERTTKNGKKVRFKYRKNLAPYASKEWDKSAMRAGRGKVFAKILQRQIDKGDF